MPAIALLGDRGTQVSHRELDAIIPRLESELQVRVQWVPTDSGADLGSYDGLWLAPGAPYASDAAVFAAIRWAREAKLPFLAACGGMQYAVIEYTRNVLGRAASHQEFDGARDDNVISALACSIYGEQRLVVPVPGTRFASIAPTPFLGMHFCSYAPTARIVERLEDSGVVVGATATDAGAEVLEFPDHTFFFTTMFQPQIGAGTGEPIHPLIAAFARAVREQREHSPNV